MIGRKSFSRRSYKISAFTFLTSPTNPISCPSENFFSTWRRFPSFPLIPFGAGQVVKKFEAKGYKPVLRLDANGEPVRTDENNYVVDLHLERIDHPQELAQDLITTVGVVEHGLFLNMVDQVIVGDPNGPRVMDNPNK